MVSMIIPLDDNVFERLKHFSRVNWSYELREELVKEEIFGRYIKTGEVTDEDWKFCEKIDWHPVDELPLKEESLKRFDKAKKGKTIKFSSVADIFR